VNESESEIYSERQFVAARASLIFLKAEPEFCLVIVNEAQRVKFFKYNICNFVSFFSTNYFELYYASWCRPNIAVCMTVKLPILPALRTIPVN
jgi:membrane protein insertase Oxa1/YidC/SpoIIIJ